MKYALIAVAVVVAAVTPAHASLIIFGTQTDHPIEPGLSLDNVRLAVDLSVADGLATMTLTNASIDGETAVLKEIVIDGTDSDTGTDILWNPITMTWTSDVKFYVSSHPNGLPGYHDETADALIELQALSSPVKYGLSAGESLQVQFNTSLANGSDIYDYLAAFGGGNDTHEYSIGFHAISAAVVDGQSLSGVAAPEPATIGMLAVGSLAVLGKRRK